ncbi:MAG: choice-of-anchor D domain-containing protein [Candidatus Eisenbacteria bacterium]
MPSRFLRNLLRPWLLAAVLLGAALPAAAQVSNPPAAPILITAFPSRDFVSAEGYDDADRVIVKVIHPDGTIRSTDPAAPIAPSGGIVEVNHPGGACWWTVTPDLRAFDVVQIDVVSGPNAGRSDAVTVSNMSVQLPVQIDASTVEVYGTARNVVNGGQLALGSLACRLLSPSGNFDINARPRIEAPGEGLLRYDGLADIHWTATFSGLSPADVENALSCEARIIELIGTTGLVIVERGPAATAGPMGGCNAPLEELAPLPGSELIPPTTVTDLSATVSFNNRVTLDWSPSTDNVGVTAYRVFRDGIVVAIAQRPSGFPPAPDAFIENNVPAGTHVYTVQAADEVGNRSEQSNAVTVVTMPAPDPNTPANEPPIQPISLIAFPSRDFVSCSGFEATDLVDVLIIRDGQVISSALGLVPSMDPDPTVAGIVEVNHPGGACWEGVTPDVRYGDILRTIARRADGSIRTADQTHVMGITALPAVVVREDDPLTAAQEGIVEVHGTSVGLDGRPLPLTQIEQRLVARNDRFDLNGRRTLRAGPGSDGTLSYDAGNNPGGMNWTARYVGLNGNDIARVRGGVSTLDGATYDQAEPRIQWNGNDPNLLTELTIYENSAGNPPGPMPGCAALETIDTIAPTAPTGFSSVSEGANAQRLSWLPSRDDWSVAYYRVFRDGVAIGQVAGSVLTYLDVFPPPGPHDYHAIAYDHATARGAALGQEQQIVAGLGIQYGNASPPSETGGSIQPDNVAPTIPANLVAVAAGANVTLNWSPSTDNVVVAGYGVYRDGAKIADVNAPLTAYIDAGLASGSYSYTVDAVDAIGNRSPESDSALANVVLEADVTAPSVPPAAFATVSPDLHGRDVVVTWGTSIDNVGVTGYSVYRDGVKLVDVNAATHSYTDAALATETYEYTVDAFDSANNRSAQSVGAGAVVANDPPASGHALIAFPSRDFISASGYPAEEGPYFFTLFRGGIQIRSQTANSDADGLLEVNHPGGTCWEVMTPDLRAGDVIRITNAAGIADQMTVADVSAERGVATGPGTVQVHGSAVGGDGLPIPVAQLEHRFISAGDLFEVNGRRDLRAAGGIDLAYDAPGSPLWTATYTGLSAADMLRLCGGVDEVGTAYEAAESRAVWMGREPLALVELTIQETGPGVTGGPSAPCGAVAEPSRPAASAAPAALLFGDVPAQPATVSAAQTVQFRNIGTGSMSIARVYLAGLNSGDYSITGAVPATLAAGGTLNISVRFAPSALGLRQATLNLACNAANTTDLAVVLNGTGVISAAPSAPGVPAASIQPNGNLAVLAGAQLANSTIPVTVTWAASAGTLTSYELQQSSNGGAWAAVAAPPGSATSTTLALAMGTSAAPKSYQFRVRAMNGASASPWTTAPAFALTPLDQTSTQVKFNGTWTNANVAAAYGGSVRFSTNNRSKVELPNRAQFTIRGSIAWIATMGPDRGRAAVSIDKGVPVTVDLYSPVVRQAVVAFAVNDLASGRQHSISVQVLGTRNVASVGVRVDMDGFVLLNGSSITAPLAAEGVSGAPLPGDIMLTVGQTAATLEFAPISPNPSRGEAMLSFSLPRDGAVELGVMDIQGRLVRTVHQGALPAGAHHIQWDGRNATGQNTEPGVYFAVLRFGDKALTKRIVRVQ